MAEGIQRLASARGPEVPARRQLSDIGSALDILIDRITNAVGPSQIHVPTWITRETAELLDAIAVCTQLLTRALIVLDQPVRITALAEQLRRRADGAVRASSDSLRGPEPDLYERLSGVIDAFGVIATTLARSASSSPVSARSHAVPRRQRQHPTTAVDEATPTVGATSSDETADTGHHVVPQPQSGDRTRGTE
ncbi:hypothetical protein ACWEKT_40385 [Nocardia takedensis]|uniref:hypothetical protein n=1 Tax=Nocardia takedensis TaxID=259390 RepID=UPI003F768DF3